MEKGKDETDNNHYISKFIIKNFKEKGKPLYELDCNSGIITERSIDNKNKPIFSGKKLWGQDVEDTIDNKHENLLAPILKSLRTGNNVINWKKENTYHWKIVQEHNYIERLNTQVLQSALFQKFNQSDNIPDDILKKMYTGNFTKMNTVYISVNPNRLKNYPLILIDNMIYTYANRDIYSADIDTIIFVYPVSPSEFIYIGKQELLEMFFYYHPSPHCINVASIKTQEVKCKVASGNQSYINIIKSILPNINSFDNANSLITAHRHEQNA